MIKPKELNKSFLNRLYLGLLRRKKLIHLGDDIITVNDAVLSRTGVRKSGKKTVTDYRIEHPEGWRCVVEEMQYGNAVPRIHIRSIYPADEKTADVVHVWIRRQGEAH